MMKECCRLQSEHEARFGEWRDHWIANAMSTAPMTEEDRAVCREAAFGLYAAAGLPPPKHIVFVPSPFAAVFAGGFAAAIWYRSRNGPATTVAATWAATNTQTKDATGIVAWRAATAAKEATTKIVEENTAGVVMDPVTAAATWAVTAAATRAATEVAVRPASEVATKTSTSKSTGASLEDGGAVEVAAREAMWTLTVAATKSATMSATKVGTEVAEQGASQAAIEGEAWDADPLHNWYVMPCDMRRLAEEIGVGDFGLQCAAHAWRMWQGGNQWSSYDACLSFFQDVAKLPIDWSNYRHWRALAELSGPRIMHPDFCMISDRPELLLVDNNNRPHSEDGPFCRWRDGTALYSHHGTRVPA